MADKIIYRPTDIYSVVNENILQIETDFVRDLDIPVVCMSSISKTFYQKHGFNVILECQNGVHKSFYNLNNKVVKNTDLPLLNLSAIYVGAIDDRIDLDWLSFMCKTFPNIEFDIFSPADSRGLSLLEFSNLHFKGAVEFGDLPSLLRNYNFGLLPFNDHRKNQSRSPMKLYEYLASGLKVLTTEYFTDERGLSIKIDRETLWSEEVLRSAINISPEDQLSNQYLVRSMDWDSITGRIIEAMNDH
jgi:teichuronic acid biosynthesis glycosyltransferase TuaH